jgi:uncharacterized lipoprotein YajG
MKMKKAIAIIAALLMLTACGNKQQNSTMSTITPNPKNATATISSFTSEPETFTF